MAFTSLEDTKFVKPKKGNIQGITADIYLVYLCFFKTCFDMVIDIVV